MNIPELIKNRRQELAKHQIEERGRCAAANCPGDLDRHKAIGRAKETKQHRRQQHSQTGKDPARRLETEGNRRFLPDARMQKRLRKEKEKARSCRTQKKSEQPVHKVRLFVSQGEIVCFGNIHPVPFLHRRRSSDAAPTQGQERPANEHQQARCRLRHRNGRCPCRRCDR